jgi:hypothetical protein
LTDRGGFSAARVGGGEAFSGPGVYAGGLDTRKLGVLSLAALELVAAGDEFGLGLRRDASLLYCHAFAGLLVDPFGVYRRGGIKAEVHGVDHS